MSRNYAMSHYRIKCVSCGNIMKSNEVVYRLAGEEFEQDTGSYLLDEAEQAGSGLQFSDDVGTEARDVTWSELREMAREGKLEAAWPIWDTVNVNPEADSEEVVPGSLMVGVELSGLQNGRRPLSGVIRRRRCPRCRRLLSQYAGRVPIYTLGILGHSSVGKTVYFSILHRYLQRIFPVQGGELSSQVDLSHLEREERVSFDAMTDSIYRGRRLPDTTQNPINQPYCRLFSYRKSGESGCFNRCLLSLRDVMGELFGRDAADRDRAQLAAVELCNQGDGILMIVDPLTMRLPRERLAYEDRVNQEAGENELRNIARVVGVGISSGEPVKKPSVVMLGKSDILQRRHDILQIDAGNPIVAEGFKNPMVWENAERDHTDWFREFLDPLHEDTKRCIDYLDGDFFSFLHASFPQALYAPVSSLGSNVTISKGEQGAVEIDNPDLIAPRFVELPILYFLMQFHILPPLHTPGFASNPDQGFAQWVRRYAQR